MSDSDDEVVEAPSGQSLADDERAELSRLRSEVAALRLRAEGNQLPSQRDRASRRSAVAVVLICLGCLLAPLSVVGVWARDHVSDTDRYLATVTPLASDPGVQIALADRVTDEILRYVDVRAIVGQAVDVLAARGLPPATADRLRGLSGPVAGAVRGFVQGKVREVIASPRFESAWVTANRVAHEQFVAALSGRQGAVTVSAGRVTIDLGAFVATAKDALVSAGFTPAAAVPTVHPTYELFASRDLARAQFAYRLLDRLGNVLPVVALAFLVTGVYPARRHRRAIIGAGLGLAAAMLVLDAVLVILRTMYLDRLPDTVPATTAATVFDTLVRFLRTELRAVLVVGLVVAAAAFASGPSVTATGIRRGSTDALAWLRERGEALGLRTGPVGAWIHRNLRALRVVVVAAAAVVFAFWDRPTGSAVLVLAGATALALALLQFLARPPAASGRTG